MTRGELRILIRKRLGETTEAFWTNSELNGWINLACNDLAFRTKCIRTDGFFSAPAIEENTLSEASSEFTLSTLFSDLYAITEVYFHIEGSRWTKLVNTNRTDLDVIYPGWKDDVGRTIPAVAGSAFTVTGITQASPTVVTTSTPHGFSDNDEVVLTGVLGMTEINGTSYYVKSAPTTTTLELEVSPTGPDLDSTTFTAYASAGTINTLGDTTYNFDSRSGTPTHYYWDREDDLFGIWVPPNTINDTSNNVRVYYQQKHTDLSADGESPQIPEPLHQAIIDWVVWTGYESRGWGDKANDALAKYLSKVKDYEIERNREKSDEEVIAKNYRNVDLQNY